VNGTNEDMRMTTCALSRLPLWRPALLALAMALLGASQATAVCVGDCDGDGRVSIANLQACVNRGSGLPAPSCPAADQNNDGTVDPNEVDRCVQGFLDASTCPMVFTPAPTNTVGLTPGALSGSFGYRAELREQPRVTAAVITTCAAGAVLGAILLLALPSSVFEAIVPWLILGTCLLVGAQPRISRWLVGSSR